MGKMLGLVFVLFCWTARAQFVPAAEGLSKAGLNPTLADATVRVVATNPNGQTMQCSATYISDQGHLLLASHCLELALFGRPLLDPSLDQNVLSLEVNDRSEEWRVRLISPCRRPDIVASLPDEMSLVSIRDCEYYDLAILEPLRPRSVPACVPVFNAPYASGPIATVGYPMRTFRIREPNSLGNQVYFSRGAVGAASSCKVVVSDISDRVGLSYSLEDGLNQARVENALQTNLDVVPGNSGGIVIDGESGDPVAVVSFAAIPMGLDPLRERCDAGGSFISELAHLPQALRVWSPKTDWPSFSAGISCQHRRVH